jgi:hypothetical protein
MCVVDTGVEDGDDHTGAIEPCLVNRGGTDVRHGRAELHLVIPDWSDGTHSRKRSEVLQA